MSTYTTKTSTGDIVKYTNDDEFLVRDAIIKYLDSNDEFIPKTLEVSTYETDTDDEFYYLIFTDKFLAHGEVVRLFDKDHKEILEYCKKMQVWNSNKVKPMLPTCLIEFNSWSLELREIASEDLDYA